jgi:glycosidase
MRYLPGMPDVEGAVCNPFYNRSGCRTPMQCDDGPNAGFSTADPSRLYLPVDPDPQRPTVASQESDPASTLNLVRRLSALRRATPALQARASTRVVNEGYPFAYMRGETHLVVVNPRREPATLTTQEAAHATPLWGLGVQTSAQELHIDGFGYGVMTLPT